MFAYQNRHFHGSNFRWETSSKTTDDLLIQVQGTDLGEEFERYFLESFYSKAVIGECSRIFKDIGHHTIQIHPFLICIIILFLCVSYAQYLRRFVWNRDVQRHTFRRV